VAGLFEKAKAKKQICKNETDKLFGCFFAYCLLQILSFGCFFAYCLLQIVLFFCLLPFANLPLILF